MSTTHTDTSHQDAQIDESLHAWLINYKEENDLTNKTLGKRLGYVDGSTVTRYLNRNKSGDISKFERALSAYKDAAEKRMAIAPKQLWETSVLRQTHNFADIVKSALDFGILHGPAGVGKSTAARAYVEIDPTAVYIEANACQNTQKGVRSLLWDACGEKRGYSHGTSRWKYIVDNFRGSERLILVDNGQRLMTDGRDCFFDFHDATGCPVLLIGNPSILADVAKVDQHHSRCLLQHEVRVNPNEIAAIARHAVERHFPGAKDLYPYARQVVERDGHIRALDKVLVATSVFRDLKGIKDLVKAFKSAHAKSTRSYKLID